LSKIIYLVLAYNDESVNSHYIWVGGRQNDRLADARYWDTEEEAQAVVDKNNKSWETFLKTMENEVGCEHVLALSYKVIPMEHKIYMKQCLTEK
jgi:hypothetical protein